MSLTMPTVFVARQKITSTLINLLGGWANAPRIELYNSGATVNDVTATAIPFAGGTETYKSDTGLHSTSSNNTRITLTTTGVWLVTARVDYSTTGTGTYRQAQLMVNGSSGGGGVASYASDTRIPGTAAVPAICRISTLVRNTVNTDYVEIQAKHDHGSAMTVPVVFTAVWLTGP